MTERKAGQCRDAEPRLDELLEDPVLHAILRKDRISRDELMTVIAGARRRLGLCEEAAR